MTTTRRAAIVSLCLAAALCGLWAPTAGRAADGVATGAPRTETRSLPEFQAIAVEGSIDLRVRQGAQQVQVRAGEAELARIETVVESRQGGPTLVVRWKPGVRDVRWVWNWVWNRDARDAEGAHGPRATVTLPRLNAIGIAGSADVVVERFETPALKLSLAGSGDARFTDLTAAELGVSISGSGDVTGKGTVGKVVLSIAGSGDVRFAELQADEVQVKIAGSGDATVNAQKLLAVSIAGSGDVVYVGNPTLTSSVAGSSSVSKR